MTKKSYLLLALVFTLAIFMIFKVIKFVKGIETPDLEYNTVYSEKYDESLFNNSLIGLSKAEIIKKFDKPLKIDIIKTNSRFLYKNKNDSIFIDCNGGVDLSHFNMLHKKENFLVFTFDENEIVKDIFNIKNSERINSDSLIGTSKAEIIKKYGKPNQIAEVKENGEVLFFSNIKEGAYTGKMPKIYLRKVMFNKNNIAIKVIKAEGNPLNPTEGICKIYSN
jgi:aspartate 1-decarboxylase